VARLLLVLLFALPAFSQEKPTLERRVNDLAHELRCLVCQNQTIADSNAPLAQDLRNQIREQLQDGKSEREVRLALAEDIAQIQVRLRDLRDVFAADIADVALVARYHSESPRRAEGRKAPGNATRGLTPLGSPMGDATRGLRPSVRQRKRPRPGRHHVARAFRDRGWDCG